MKTVLLLSTLFITVISFAQIPQGPLPRPLPDDPATPQPPTSPGRIQIGEFVASGPINLNMYLPGVVVQVSHDGRTIDVRDDEDWKIYRRDASLISREMGCGPRSICPGELVISGPFNTGPRYFTGVVLKTYERGLFLVKDDVDGGRFVRHESKVNRRRDK